MGTVMPASLTLPRTVSVAVPLILRVPANAIAPDAQQESRRIEYARENSIPAIHS